MSLLEPEVLARARHRLYGLLGRLLVEGPRPEALALARAVPTLAAVLPPPDAGPDVLDDLAAAHYAATTEVSPVASAVLGDDGLIGGPVADAIRAAYLAGGFHPSRTDVAIDHVGLQLAYLAHLCDAEAQAHADGALDAVERLTALQQGFLDDPLARWLPAWVVASGDAGGPVWRTVAELSLELVASHRSASRRSASRRSASRRSASRRSASRRSAPAPDAAPATTAGPGLDLDDPDVDLRSIATLIVRPARSGWLLSRTALARVCAAAGVTSGLGERGRVLAGALESAAALGQLQPLVEALMQELEAWQAQLERLGTQLLLPTEPWLARARQTHALLTTVRDAVIQVR